MLQAPRTVDHDTLKFQELQEDLQREQEQSETFPILTWIRIYTQIHDRSMTSGTMKQTALDLLLFKNITNFTFLCLFPYRQQYQLFIKPNLVVQVGVQNYERPTFCLSTSSQWHIMSPLIKASVQSQCGTEVLVRKEMKFSWEAWQRSERWGERAAVPCQWAPTFQ